MSCINTKEKLYFDTVEFLIYPLTPNFILFNLMIVIFNHPSNFLFVVCINVLLDSSVQRLLSPHLSLYTTHQLRSFFTSVTLKWLPTFSGSSKVPFVSISYFTSPVKYGVPSFLRQVQLIHVPFLLPTVYLTIKFVTSMS